MEGTQLWKNWINQLHKRNCFEPVDVSQMTKFEKKKAMDSLLFLTEKRDSRVKGRLVYNGKPTRWKKKKQPRLLRHVIGGHHAHCYQGRKRCHNRICGRTSVCPFAVTSPV
jgi:hypothetical protein